jgi:hypothetical protein
VFKECFCAAKKMYRENGLLFPWSYLHNFSQELHQLEEYCQTQKFNASMVPSLSLSLHFFDGFFFIFNKD